MTLLCYVLLDCQKIGHFPVLCFKYHISLINSINCLYQKEIIMFLSAANLYYGAWVVLCYKTITVTQKLVTLSHSDRNIYIIFSRSLFRLTPADYITVRIFMKWNPELGKADPSNVNKCEKGEVFNFCRNRWSEITKWL